jgi:hypothetical protein
MSFGPMLRDALLPNRAWLGRIISPTSKGQRLKYLAFRIALLFVVLAVLYFFNLHQHPQL